MVDTRLAHRGCPFTCSVQRATTCLPGCWGNSWRNGGLSPVSCPGNLDILKFILSSRCHWVHTDVSGLKPMQELTCAEICEWQLQPGLSLRDAFVKCIEVVGCFCDLLNKKSIRHLFAWCDGVLKTVWQMRQDREEVRTAIYAHRRIRSCRPLQNHQALPHPSHRQGNA